MGFIPRLHAVMLMELKWILSIGQNLSKPKNRLPQREPPARALEAGVREAGVREAGEGVW
jgi:hypothetical protein